jgi:hypothetical protein
MEELLDLGPHDRTELGVEVRQRLVHQEHLGLADERPRERDAPALAARQLRRLAPEIVGDAEPPGAVILDLLLDVEGRVAGPPLSKRLP